MALNTDSTDYLTVRRLWSIMSSFKDKIVTALGKKSDKSSTVSNVAWSSSKLTKTINGTTTDVVSASTLKSAMSLNNVTNDAQVKRSEMGAASGVATLDANGIINTSQLPSYVDDVLEYSAKSQFPATGETGKIYVDTSTNITWRWSGTTYVEISPSLALGETSSTAYRGDRGKTAYDHSQVTSGNPHNVTATDVKAVSYDTNLQNLTDTQKSNARTNIGISASDLIYDCGTGSTSTTDFDNALAAFNAGRWVIIHTNSSIYYCVGTYDNGLRFRQLTNETYTMKVSTVTWTRGNPLVRTQLEASLSGHTHSQYLTASDITGKMNTSGGNATAPSSSGGDGATATLLNNLTGPNNLDDIASDNVLIPTTNSDGTDQTKWYKRPLSKLWPWILSHTKTRILKASDDVYWGVGADSTHAIDLDYDGSASSPTMGLWVRWGSGSSNAKYMAECDASGNCKFNGNASSATTISGSQVLLPAHSSDGYIGVEQSGKAKAYLEAYDSKGGVWVNNGGKTNWLAYRDSDGAVHFGADSSSGYRGVAGDESVKNLFNGVELCGNSYMNSGTSHYRFYFGKMTPGTDNGAKNFCGLIEVNNISTTSGAVRGTGFVAIVKIDARNYDEFFVSMSIINNNGWNLTGLRPTLIVTESGDDRQFGIGFTNASGALQAFQYTRFNVTGIGYSNGFTYYRLFSATSTKSSSDYFWPAKLGDAENADTVDGYHIVMGSYGGAANTIYFG